MAHIDPRPSRGAGLFVRFVYWIAKRRFGRVPIPLGIMAYSPKVLQSVGGYELSADKTRAIAPRLKALAELKSATIVGCRFCIDIGSSLAAAHGITPDDLRDIPHFTNSPRFSALEKQVMQYAVLMSEAPMVVPRRVFDVLLGALGTQAMVELTAAIAWENFRSRFNHAFGAKEEGYSENMLCMLPAAPDPEQAQEQTA